MPSRSNHLSPAESTPLISTGYHLPYNPMLKERARELRKNMTPAEKKLWYGFLRTFRYPVLRQRPIDNFIVDFYCAYLKLVIEIDGDTHYAEKDQHYDQQRTRVLENYGLKVMRFTNLEVENNIEGVCRMIEEYESLPAPLTKGGESESLPAPLAKGGESESLPAPLAKGGESESLPTPLDKGGEEESAGQY